MTSDKALELIDDYLDGTADADAVAQLKAWLESDNANVHLFAHQAFLHQQLREMLLAENTTQCLAEKNPSEADEPRKDSPTSTGITFPADPGLGQGNIWTMWSGMPFILVAFTLTLIACGLAFQFGWKSGAGSLQPVNLTSAESRSEAPYVAKLVRLTNCQWDSARTTADLNRGSQLSPGQSLHLLEGVAEINSIFRSGIIDKFRLEGPAGLTIGSEGVPSLLYGQLSATVTIDYEPFALDTPLGRVMVSEDACIGVSANSNEAEVHVFFGSATFEPLRRFRSAAGTDRWNVASGSALRVASTSEGSLIVENGVAKEEGFITQASLTASRLNITENYVAAVKSAQPLAYWRFDQVRDGRVFNEVGNRYACHIHGPVRWRTYPAGNRSAEFGFSNEAGFLMSDDPIDGALRDNFTVEMWVKPSYFQTGSVFSLVQCEAVHSEAGDADVPLQCVLIELLGQAQDPSAVAPCRIRFLHRNPPGRDVRTGVACFSNELYAPRKWQHLAAVKEGGSLKMYVDGKLVAEERDASNTPDGLRILIGQLFSFTSGPNAGIRPFVGELAEVALYGKALPIDEISKHIKLAREEAADRNSF